MNLNFNSIFEGNTANNTQKFEHSPKMVTYYLDLCTQKQVKPANTSYMTSKELQNAISTLRNMPNLATPGQITAIREVIEELIDLGSDRNHFPDAYLSRLTGGREGQASALLQELYAERKELQVNAPPSREQIITLATWYICPDIPFEEFGIRKTVPLQELRAWTYEDNKGTGTEVVPYRQMTATEFGQEITRVFKRADAQAFINQFQQVHYNWKSTRITDSQIQKIKRLEYYNNTLFAGAGVQVDEEGNYYREHNTGKLLYDEVTKEYTQETTKHYLETNFTKLDNRTLRQYSREEANKLIMIMQLELDDRQNSFSNPYDDIQEALEFKHTTYSELQQRDNEYLDDAGVTHTRQAKTVASAREVEMENLNKSIVFCEATVGHNNDELREQLTVAVLDNDELKGNVALQELFNFFMLSIDMKNEDTIRKSVARLGNACESSLIATKVYEELRTMVLPQDVEKEQARLVKRQKQLSELN